MSDVSEDIKKWPWPHPRWEGGNPCAFCSRKYCSVKWPSPEPT